MSAKTSQLQIRVTPDEKAALKRLALAAGTSVSRYVLDRVIPSAELALAQLMDRLGDSGESLQEALSELARALHGLPGEDLTHGVPVPDADLPLARLNRVAALVEAEAARKGVEPPVWAREMPLLERPQFWWGMSSLKPHQMRVTPVAFKRRNLFFDPASGPAPELAAPLGPVHDLGGDRDGRLLQHLDEELASREVVAELYLLGGAVLVQSLAAKPSTANVRAMFRPAADVDDAVRVVAGADDASDTWHHDSVRRILGNAPGGARLAFVELANLRVFEPLPEYVLALKCAAMSSGTATREVDDVRYVMRAMNVTSADSALAIVSHYFTPRQLPPDIRARLESLLTGAA